MRYSISEKKKKPWKKGKPHQKRSHEKMMQRSRSFKLQVVVLPRSREVLPLGSTTAPTTARSTVWLQRFYGSKYGSRYGTTAPNTALPACLCAETWLRPLYPCLDPLAYKYLAPSAF